jgi:hypothetical protein
MYTWECILGFAIDICQGAHHTISARVHITRGLFIIEQKKVAPMARNQLCSTCRVQQRPHHTGQACNRRTLYITRAKPAIGELSTSGVSCWDLPHRTAQTRTPQLYPHLQRCDDVHGDNGKRDPRGMQYADFKPATGANRDQTPQTPNFAWICAKKENCTMDPDQIRSPGCYGGCC